MGESKPCPELRCRRDFNRDSPYHGTTGYFMAVADLALRANDDETKRRVKFRLWVRGRMSRGHAKPNRRNDDLGRYRNGRRPKAECRAGASRSRF
jgi:hypothetical protein